MPIHVYNSRPREVAKQHQELNLQDFALFNEGEEPIDMMSSIKKGLIHKNNADIIPENNLQSSNGLSNLSKMDLNN